MQESVNKAMDQMTATVGEDAPSLKEVENKIQARMAQASAKAELTEATSPEAAIAELKAGTTDLKAPPRSTTCGPSWACGGPRAAAGHPRPQPRLPPPPRPPEAPVRDGSRLIPRPSPRPGSWLRR